MSGPRSAPGGASRRTTAERSVGEATFAGGACARALAGLFCGRRAGRDRHDRTARRGRPPGVERGDLQGAGLRRRVALLKGVPAEALQEVYDQRLKINPGAPELIHAAKAAGLQTLLVSGGFTFFADRVKARLLSLIHISEPTRPY